MLVKVLGFHWYRIKLPVMNFVKDRLLKSPELLWSLILFGPSPGPRPLTLTRNHLKILYIEHGLNIRKIRPSQPSEETSPYWLFWIPGSSRIRNEWILNTLHVVLAHPRCTLVPRQIPLKGFTGSCLLVCVSRDLHEWFCDTKHQIRKYSYTQGTHTPTGRYPYSDDEGESSREELVSPVIGCTNRLTPERLKDNSNRRVSEPLWLL